MPEYPEPAKDAKPAGDSKEARLEQIQKEIDRLVAERAKIMRG